MLKGTYRKKIGLVLVILGLLMVFGNMTEVYAREKIDVFVSFYPLYDVATKVGGDKVNVELVIPNGAEVHSYDPSPRRLAQLEKAQLFFYNGLGLEPWGDKVVKNLRGKDVRVIRVSDGVNILKFGSDFQPATPVNSHLHQHNHSSSTHSQSDCDHHVECDHEDSDYDHDNCDQHHDHADCDYHHDCDVDHSGCDHDDHKHAYTNDHDHTCEYAPGQDDPHIWLDPMNMKKIARMMADEFTQIDPRSKDFYEKNYMSYANELDKLDAEFRTVLKDRKEDYIIVSHAAFGYMTYRYGLKQLPVTGIAPHEEPTPGTLAKLVKEAKEKNLKYVFMETLASPRTVNVLAKEANLQVLTLNPIAGLTDQERRNNEDYISLMRKNLANLQKALVD